MPLAGQGHQTRLASYSGAAAAAATQPPSRFIYIDQSNISVTAQNRNHTQHGAELNILGLTRLLARGGYVVKRHVAGSFPAENHRIWETYRTQDYVVHHEGGHGGSERFVDNALHAVAYKDISDCIEYPGPFVLVLATGDGNSNGGHGSTNFPSLVQLAVKLGWTVELWSFSCSRSGIYADLQRQHPDKITLCQLDDHTDLILSQAPTRSPPQARPPPVTGGHYASAGRSRGRGSSRGRP